MIQPPLQMDTTGAAGYRVPAAPTVSFVGATAMLEPEHVTVGAAPMPAAPKKSPVAISCFSRSELSRQLHWMMTQLSP